MQRLINKAKKFSAFAFALAALGLMSDVTGLWDFYRNELGILALILMAVTIAASLLTLVKARSWLEPPPDRETRSQSRARSRKADRLAVASVTVLMAASALLAVTLYRHYGPHEATKTANSERWAASSSPNSSSSASPMPTASASPPGQIRTMNARIFNNGGIDIVAGGKHRTSEANCADCEVQLLKGTTLLGNGVEFAYIPYATGGDPHPCQDVQDYHPTIDKVVIIESNYYCVKTQAGATGTMFIHDVDHPTGDTASWVGIDTTSA